MPDFNKEKDSKQINNRLFTKEEVAIRNHNCRLMKFILFIVLIILVVFSVAWYFGNQNIINVVGGGALTLALVALWIMNHTPEVKLNHIKLKSEK